MRETECNNSAAARERGVRGTWRRAHRAPPHTRACHVGSTSSPLSSSSPIAESSAKKLDLNDDDDDDEPIGANDAGRTGGGKGSVTSAVGTSVGGSTSVRIALPKPNHPSRCIAHASASRTSISK